MVWVGSDLIDHPVPTPLTFKIILLLGHLTKRAFNPTVFWICILQKPTTLQKGCVSFLLVGGDIAAILLITSVGI